jgi:hypothetical protein
MDPNDIHSGTLNFVEKQAIGHLSKGLLQETKVFDEYLYFIYSTGLVVLEGIEN